MTSTSARSEAAEAFAQAEGGTGQYLGLYIGEEEYAIGILQVREILRFEPVTRVPGTPASVRGVMNVRGAVVPVIDLALKFGLPETVVTNRTCVVILEVRLGGEPAVMGVMADAVSQVVELGPRDILPPPPFGTRVNTRYFVGMGRTGRKFILVLDVQKVLSEDELRAAEVAAEPVTNGATDGPEPGGDAAPAGA